MKFLVAGDSSYNYPFAGLGIVTNDREQIKSCNVLVLTGGSDVCPSMYGHSAHSTARCNPGRDKVEVDLVKEATKRDIPMIGICRGAQFLTVVAGGKLIQDCNNHTRHHAVTTKDGESFIVTSSHHQMMDPYWGDLKNKHKLLAWADNLATKKEAQQDCPVIMPKEPEAIWYPEIKGLAVQWHPEWMAADSRGFEYFIELVEEYVMK